MIKISRAFFVLMFATLAGAFLVVMASFLVGFLHGDHRNFTISGSPTLDSPSIPYWVHWSHVVMYYGAFIIIASLILGLVTLVLSAILPKNP